VGINSVKYQFVAGPIYIHVKKHKCIYCGEKVVPSFQTTVVNSFSPEAKNYDFTIGNTFFPGNCAFKTRCFYCPGCGRYISVREMKESEKS